MQHLRRSVNQAKANPQNYEYLEDYQKNQAFFNKEFSSEHSFQFSEEESQEAKKLLNDSEGDGSYDQMNQLMSDRPEVGISEEDEISESMLNPLLECLQFADWKEPVGELFNNLGSEEQRFKLVRELIADTNAARTGNKKQCILYLISLLGLESKDIKKQLFEDLQNEKAIEDYDYYLLLQGDVLRGRLIDLIGALGRKQVCGEAYNYGVQREFQPVKRALHSMCGGEAVQEIGLAVEDTSRFFDSWRRKNNPSDDATKQLVGGIVSCLASLKETIQLFKTPCLQRKHVEEQIAARKISALFDERREFNKKMASFEITSVSYQRIAELFPDKEQYSKKIQQCEKLGVTLFDANDTSAREKAIREHRLIKSCLSC